MEKKLKVLIADNSSQFAKACQNELETQGYDVSVIENDGAKVLEIVKKHNIDVILMDVFMVNEDAVDVLEYYQTHSVEKPIISGDLRIMRKHWKFLPIGKGNGFFCVLKE